MAEKLIAHGAHQFNPDQAGDGLQQLLLNEELGGEVGGGAAGALVQQPEAVYAALTVQGLDASAVEGKVNLMATATDSAQKKGAHAGNLIKAIAGLVGGGGGGRPGMAQAGGKDPSGIDTAIAKVAEVVAEQIS